MALFRGGVVIQALSLFDFHVRVPKSTNDPLRLLLSNGPLGPWRSRGRCVPGASCACRPRPDCAVLSNERLPPRHLLLCPSQIPAIHGPSATLIRTCWHPCRSDAQFRPKARDQSGLFSTKLADRRGVFGRLRSQPPPYAETRSTIKVGCVASYGNSLLRITTGT